MGVLSPPPSTHTHTLTSGTTNHNTPHIPICHQLTLTTLNYFRLNIETNAKCAFQFEIIINVFIRSFFESSFEYLCYLSTAIINIFTLTARGSTLDARI